MQLLHLLLYLYFANAFKIMNTNLRCCDITIPILKTSTGLEINVQNDLKQNTYVQ